MPKPKDAREAQAQPAAWADLRKRRKGVKTQVVPVILDYEAMAAIQVLEDEMREAVDTDRRTNGPKRAPAIAKQIEELEDRARESIHQFKVRSIGTHWDVLLGEHPPTEESRQRGGAVLLGDKFVDISHIVDVRSFREPAVQSCLIDPLVEEDDWDEFWNELDAGTRDSLFSASMQVNQAVMGAVPSSRLASALLRGSGETSTTAAPEASHTASSSAGS